MMYKAVSTEGKMPAGGAVVCAVATADNPLGPFTKHSKPLFTNPENPWSVEDPVMWFENNKYYALAKDFQGYFTGAGKNQVALFESADGFNWSPSSTPLGFIRQIVWEDGTKEPLQVMERPQLFFDDSGKPSVLMCACVAEGVSNRSESFNVQIPII